VSTPPTPASQLISAARSAAMAGDHAEAESLYRQVLAQTPENIEAWMALATLLNTPAQKREALERVLAIAPEHVEAAAALARLEHSSPAPVPTPTSTPAPVSTLYCANHPNRETLLRCNKCNKPICMDCAVQTPVGYRCKDCVRAQQDKFYTATPTNQLAGTVGAAVSGLLLGIAALLLARLMGFSFFGILIAIFAGPALGGALARLIWKFSGRKRARSFNLIATGITVIIAAPIAIFLSGSLLMPLVVIGLAASTLYARLR